MKVFLFVFFISVESKQLMGGKSNPNIPLLAEVPSSSHQPADVSAAGLKGCFLCFHRGRPEWTDLGVLRGRVRGRLGFY